MNSIKLGIISGLFFGIFMGVFWFLLGIFFPASLGISSSNAAIVIAIFQGVFCGVLFGIFFPLGAKSYVKILTHIFHKENEAWLQSMTILYSGIANHYMGFGGHLILTPDVLIFKSNIQNRSLEIPLEQCDNVSTVNYYYFVPTGMQIKTKNGTMIKCSRSR